MSNGVQFIPDGRSSEGVSGAAVSAVSGVTVSVGRRAGAVPAPHRYLASQFRTNWSTLTVEAPVVVF
jgi:hypothetical protein